MFSENMSMMDNFSVEVSHVYMCTIYTIIHYNVLVYILLPYIIYIYIYTNIVVLNYIIIIIMNNANILIYRGKSPITDT